MIFCKIINNYSNLLKLFTELSQYRHSDRKIMLEIKGLTKKLRYGKMRGNADFCCQLV